jgi:anti-anti-sigma factor
MNRPLLTYNIDQRGDEICLALGGDLDMSVAEQLETPLAEAAAHQPHTLTVDLGTVQFIDSHSIGLLVRAYNTAQAADRRPPTAGSP